MKKGKERVGETHRKALNEFEKQNSNILEWWRIFHTPLIRPPNGTQTDEPEPGPARHEWTLFFAKSSSKKLIFSIAQEIK